MSTLPFARSPFHPLLDRACIGCGCAILLSSHEEDSICDNCRAELNDWHDTRAAAEEAGVPMSFGLPDVHEPTYSDSE